MIKQYDISLMCGNCLLNLLCFASANKVSRLWVITLTFYHCQGIELSGISKLLKFIQCTRVCLTIKINLYQYGPLTTLVTINKKISQIDEELESAYETWEILLEKE